MNENNNLAYLLTYVNYWPINFNSSQILAYFPLSPFFLILTYDFRVDFDSYCRVVSRITSPT